MSSRKSHLLVRLALSDQEYWLLHLNDPTLETRTLEVFYWPRKSFNWQSYKISTWQVLQKSDFDVIYLNFWSNIALRGQNEASSFFLSEDIFLKIDLMKCGSIKKICWNVWKSFCYLYSKGWTQKLILPLLLVWDPLVPLTLFAPGVEGGSRICIKPCKYTFERVGKAWLSQLWVWRRVVYTFYPWP